MTPEFVVSFATEAITIATKLAAPLLITELVLGLAVSIFQAVTQIQEMTLVFIPKIIAIFLTMLVALPFMGSALAGYMNRIAQHIVGG